MTTISPAPLVTELQKPTDTMQRPAVSSPAVGVVNMPGMVLSVGPSPATRTPSVVWARQYLARRKVHLEMRNGKFIAIFGKKNELRTYDTGKAKLQDAQIAAAVWWKINVPSVTRKLLSEQHLHRIEQRKRRAAKIEMIRNLLDSAPRSTPELASLLGVSETAIKDFRVAVERISPLYREQRGKLLFYSLHPFESVPVKPKEEPVKLSRIEAAYREFRAGLKIEVPTVQLKGNRL